MAVLISGCSSGIGLETALYLRKKGYEVIATARGDEAVYYLKEEGFQAIHLDVNSSESINEAVAQAMMMASDGIDVLINNAGYGQAGALEDLSRECLRDQFETNVFGLVELTNAVLPSMREQGYGQIINISSVLGFVSMPFRGAYNASKHAVESISDTLRLELANTPITVSLIEPGPIVSRFRQTCVEKALEVIDMDKSHYKATYEKMIAEQEEPKPLPFMLSGEAVAKKIFKAMTAKRPKARYRVTLPTYLLAILKRMLSSSLLDRILLRWS